MRNTTTTLLLLSCLLLFKASTAHAQTSKPTPLTFEQAKQIVFLDAPPKEVDACQHKIQCLLELRYSDDSKALKDALVLYTRFGLVAGVEEPFTMDGGYRGTIAIVPHLPTGKHRRHLSWIAKAYDDYQQFFKAMDAQTDTTIAFKWQPIALRFFRSVDRKTPSAYASRWTVGYNVSGSLHRSASAVRETMFHELFHLNDHAHDDWSSRVLGPIHETIRKRCTKPGKKPAANTPCLAKYAPGTTRVKGGTYYAFQPGNGPEEYAAELALRYYLEQRLMLAQKRLSKRPFKCNAPENMRAWNAFKDTFFAGIDLTKACR